MCTPCTAHGRSPTHLVEEELHGHFVQVEGEGLEEGDVVRKQLLLIAVEGRRDQTVDVVVGQQVDCV